jgi:hypothetical protein
MESGTTRQWGDEQLDELPGDGVAPTWTGVKAAGDGSCKHGEVMKHVSDTKMEEERARRPRSLRRGDCGGTMTTLELTDGRGTRSSMARASLHCYGITPLSKDG